MRKMCPPGPCMSRIYAVVGASTQQDLAQRLNLAQCTVSAVQRSDRIPDGWLVLLLLHYDLNPEWVLTGEGAQRLAGADYINDLEQANTRLRREVAELSDELARYHVGM